MAKKTVSSGPDRATYPGAPWHMAGELWAGLFKLERQAALPAGLKPLLNGRWFVVVLARYLDGTLRYNELLSGPLVRRGLRPGIYAQYLWVDSEASVWGGREIWGLPKELARFDWERDTLRVSDRAGLIAQVRVEWRRPRMPLLPVLMPGFGRREGEWAYISARGWACLGRAQLWLEEGGARLAPGLPQRPALGLVARPFSATFPLPRMLGR